MLCGCCSVARKNRADATPTTVRQCVAAEMRSSAPPDPRMDDSMRLHCTGQDRIRMGIMLIAIHLVQNLVLYVLNAWSQVEAQQRRSGHHHLCKPVRIRVTDSRVQFSIVGVIG
jgi:hypothetical protein